MEINYICSLGSWCLPAVYLSEHGLQRCSYPFDYILSAPEMIADCIRDDFALFLDKTRHEQCGEAPNINSNHKIYGKFSHSLLLDKTCCLNNTFRHHDITSDKDYNSFIRKVNRFRMLLKKEEPKLFLLFSQYEEFTKKQIQELDDILKTKTTNYQLMFITMIKDESVHHTAEDNGHIKIIKLYINNTSRGWLATPGDAYLNQIIGSYFVFNLKDDIKLDN